MGGQRGWVGGDRASGGVVFHSRGSFFFGARKRSEEKKKGLFRERRSYWKRRELWGLGFTPVKGTLALHARLGCGIKGRQEKGNGPCPS